TLYNDPTFGGVEGPVANVCDGDVANFTVSGLLPETAFVINFSFRGQNGLAPVTSDADGNATLSFEVSAQDDGEVLTIHSVTRTESNVQLELVANNTATLSMSEFLVYYYDADGDGYGDPALAVPSCGSPGENYVLNGTDCDDTDLTV